MTIKRFRTGSGRLDANNLNKMVPNNLLGSFDLIHVPIGAVVDCYVASNGDATNPNTVWFNRPGEFYGGCPTP